MILPGRQIYSSWFLIDIHAEARRTCDSIIRQSRLAWVNTVGTLFNMDPDHSFHKRACSDRKKKSLLPLSVQTFKYCELVFQLLVMLVCAYNLELAWLEAFLDWCNETCVSDKH